jgi:acyl-CoA synthetase (AMP-forming)/AMP-acid ligase II
MNPNRVATLGEAVQAQSTARADDLCLVVVAEDGTETKLTFGELAGHADRVRHLLTGEGVGPGDRVAIVLDHSVDLVASFWGCQLLGAVPSILPYPNRKMKPERYSQIVNHLVTSADPACVLTSRDLGARLPRLGNGSGATKVVGMEIGPPDRRGAAKAADIDPESIAVLQFSSGTTGLQKGVPASHAMLLAHHSDLCLSVDLGPEDVVVSWLPLHHDLGVLAGVILTMVAGVPAILISADHWVRRPSILLQAVDRHRGTLCWMPNFAFNHTANSLRSRDTQGLDLGSLRCLINSAEPVRLNSLENLYDRLAPLGLARSSLGTGYGLAEIGGVTLSPPGRFPTVDYVDQGKLQRDSRALPVDPGDKRATPMVSSGVPQRHMRIEIRKDGRVLPDRSVGEIVVRSPYVFDGYFGREDLTRNVLKDGWLHTGDLGYLADGELFVTGRMKDLIIVAGLNIYPEDVEAIANTVPGVYPGRVVAFGMVDHALGSEGIVLLYERRGDVDPIDVEKDLRRRVHDALNVTLWQVKRVEGGWVLKAPSGKVARTANREKYLRDMAPTRD